VVTDPLQRLGAEQEVRALGDVARVFHHIGQELAEERGVERVDLVVALADLDGGGGVARRIGIESGLELACDEVGHVLHTVVEFRREAQPFDLHRTLAELLGHIAGALEVGSDLHRGDDHPKVRGHGLAAGDHRDGEIVDLALHFVDRLVFGTHLPGELVVELEKRRRGVCDCVLDHAAHLGDQAGDVGELVFVGSDDVLVEGGGHVAVLRFGQPIRPVM
jgi:hypothetical protein